jgi:hypothetical protein
MKAVVSMLARKPELAEFGMSGNTAKTSGRDKP